MLKNDEGEIKCNIFYIMVPNRIEMVYEMVYGMVYGMVYEMD